MHEKLAIKELLSTYNWENEATSEAETQGVLDELNRQCGIKMTTHKFTITSGIVNQHPT